VRVREAPASMCRASPGWSSEPRRCRSCRSPYQRPSAARTFASCLFRGVCARSPRRIHARRCGGRAVRQAGRSTVADETIVRAWFYRWPIRRRQYGAGRRAGVWQRRRRGVGVRPQRLDLVSASRTAASRTESRSPIRQRCRALTRRQYRNHRRARTRVDIHSIREHLDAARPPVDERAR
jgi:hypothetical protein